MFPMRLALVLSFVILELIETPAFAQLDFTADEYGSDDEFAEDEELRTPEKPDMDFTKEPLPEKPEKRRRRKKKMRNPPQGRLLVTPRTMNFGGRIGLTFDTRIAKNVEVIDPNDPTVTLIANETSGGGSFTFAPEFGVFVIPQLELLIGLGVNLPFGTSTYDEDFIGGETYRNHAQKELFFDLGLRYLFDLDKLYLYLGFRGGLKYDSLYSVLLSLPFGILVPFNIHVALDVGLRFNVDIGVGNNDITWIHIPVAYFGVQGFFNFFD